MSFLTKYNFKPFLCRTSGRFYSGDGYFGAEVDVHRWGKLALNGFNVTKSQLPQTNDS